MSNNTQRGEAMPTVNVAINKSRLKSYSKNGKPTYYLANNQEFSLEVFNPTSENISARISLNGKNIGQGGLVLRPGERVFLDRYIDVSKKFRFETYEVDNTSEIRKVIENNGNLKVTFHKEYVAPNYGYYNNYHQINPYQSSPWGQPIHPWNSPTVLPIVPNPYTIYCGTSMDSGSNHTLYSGELTLNMMGMLDMGATLGDTEIKPVSSNPTRRFTSKVSGNKTIETGRVEEGSHSTQKFTQVNITFNDVPFKTYEFNLLPESTKIITSNDLNNRRYCCNCGSKVKSNYKFCPNCGSKS